MFLLFVKTIAAHSVFECPFALYLVPIIFLGCGRVPRAASVYQAGIGSTRARRHACCHPAAASPFLRLRDDVRLRPRRPAAVAACLSAFSHLLRRGRQGCVACAPPPLMCAASVASAVESLGRQRPFDLVLTSLRPNETSATTSRASNALYFFFCTRVATDGSFPRRGHFQVHSTAHLSGSRPKQRGTLVSSSRYAQPSRRSGRGRPVMFFSFMCLVPLPRPLLRQLAYSRGPLTQRENNLPLGAAANLVRQANPAGQSRCRRPHRGRKPPVPLE